jgi:preprotein translocase subunit Sss1
MLYHSILIASGGAPIAQAIFGILGSIVLALSLLILCSGLVALHKDPDSEENWNLVEATGVGFGIALVLGFLAWIASMAPEDPYPCSSLQPRIHFAGTSALT